MQANSNAEIIAKIEHYSGVELVFLHALKNLIPLGNLFVAKGSQFLVTFGSETE